MKLMIIQENEDISIQCLDIPSMKLFYFQERERERREFVEKLNYASIPTTFHGSFVIRSRKDLPGISIPFALCLSRTAQISALPDQGKKRNLRKRIRGSRSRKEETTCLESQITTLLLCQDLSPPRPLA